jgi:hypothetical protein
MQFIITWYLACFSSDPCLAVAEEDITRTCSIRCAGMNTLVGYQWILPLVGWTRWTHPHALHLVRPPVSVLRVGHASHVLCVLSKGKKIVWFWCYIFVVKSGPNQLVTAGFQPDRFLPWKQTLKCDICITWSYFPSVQLQKRITSIIPLFNWEEHHF